MQPNSQCDLTLNIFSFAPRQAEKGKSLKDRGELLGIGKLGRNGFWGDFEKSWLWDALRGFFMLADGLFGKRFGVFRWRGGYRFGLWPGERVLRVLGCFGGWRRC